MLLFDIDGLRDVNDSLGHDAGDSMVVEVAARLRALAPAAALVGRGGGDEFVVTLRLPERRDGAARWPAELRDALQRADGGRRRSRSTSTSRSASRSTPTTAPTPATLLKRADLAAQAAKQLASPVQLFHPGPAVALDPPARAWPRDLRRALESGEIEVYFQPKVALRDRRVVGVECLARWEHPTHGTVPPEDFVAVAEHTGQLGRLTEVGAARGAAPRPRTGSTPAARCRSRSTSPPVP